MTSIPSALTTADVADELRISERKARQLIADGVIKSVRIGPRIRRVRASDLADYLDGLEVEAS